MSVIEKKEDIVLNYHCNDIHAETCVENCAKCELYLREDLDELEKEIRAEVLDEFCNFVFDYVEHFFESTEEFKLYVTEQLKLQNDGTLTDDFDKYVDSQLV